MIKRFFTPGAFHGGRSNKVFFEGWYYKLISADKSSRLAVIPGVFNHKDPGRSHAFVQVLDGITSDVTYHQFPADAFKASSRAFVIQIKDSAFYHQGFQIEISSDEQSIEGQVEFTGIKPWPVNISSPGVMGPYRYAPFMQTYHGILSLDHSVQGQLTIDGKAHNFDNGRGYIEKDWGRTFPRAYIWMQSNHFPGGGISITASVATIPWLRSWFRGFLIGLLIENKLYRFTTYLGSEIKHLDVNENQVDWEIHGESSSDPERRFPGYRLTIQAQRGSVGLLKSPELDGMTPRIFESLTAVLNISLTGLDKDGSDVKTIYQGEGDCGGLEIAGTIDEILTKTRADS